MDDFEDQRVRRLRKVRVDDVLRYERIAKGLCPQCGKEKQPAQIYCGGGCSARAEAHEAPLPAK